MEKINVCIAGGTGYTAGELIRILINHPYVKIGSIVSSTNSGKRVSDVHRDLLGDCNLFFTDKPSDCDVLFLCLGHGLSKSFLSEYSIGERSKIIDLGNDFRLEAKHGKREFIYGLTELNAHLIKDSDSVSNPGCFATTIELALLPLVQNGLIADDIHIHAITGSTGAGKGLSETSHFSYRDSNISIYKLFDHQHLGEIDKLFRTVNDSFSYRINFVPMRGDFTRGIFASVYTKATNESIEYYTALYNEYYKESPFVFISDNSISLKEVVNTNKCLLHLELRNGFIHITSILDNLLKGASGQAVENMNLMFSFGRDCGLRFKANAF